MRYQKIRGFTLIDVLFSVVLLLIAITGAMQYRYHAALGVRKAKMQTAAAELALTLVETWRGLEGADTFDSQGHFNSAMNINSSTGPACPGDYNQIGSYAIQWSDYDYKATLSSKDIGNGLKSLNVIVAWPFGNSNADKEYRITSYVDTN